MSLDSSPYYHHHSQKGPKSENPPNILPTPFLNKQLLPKLETHEAASLCLSVTLVCAPLFTTHEDPSSSFTLYKPMDSDEGARVESSAGAELAAYEGDTVLEPYEGMEFESEDSAKIFYDEYARRLGFVMRVMSCRRSERDGKILARRLGCNKEGHCVSIRGKFGPDHNHPLVVSPREARQTMDEKDKKIQELTAELRNKKRLCATYQEQLNAFMKMIALAFRQ
ncbi:hypothetical protein CMV_009916 [Castanea mollissima]|uniref:FAR1 domain-containing protein n=1 Tax=Castanea mollissima TaxID=60419 RepID=A0A8J4RJ52_9ROSI|nr:hypothetical protein CMV_009916 [Castanea mollissima]